MALDPRTPVLIGTGQLSQRVDRGAPPLEPVDLIAEAARGAAADAGAASEPQSSAATSAKTERLRLSMFDFISPSLIFTGDAGTVRHAGRRREPSLHTSLSPARY